MPGPGVEPGWGCPQGILSCTSALASAALQSSKQRNEQQGKASKRGDADTKADTAFRSTSSLRGTARQGRGATRPQRRDSAAESPRAVRSTALDNYSTTAERPCAAIARPFVSPNWFSTAALVAPGTRRSPLVRRQRAKALSEANAEGLARLDSPLRFAYARTLVCANVLEQRDGIVKAKYCGARWCVVCARVRSAKSAARYLAHVERWGAHAHFVTLTVPNVKGNALHATVRTILAAMRSIADAVRRTDRLPFEAIRKLEVTPEEFSASIKGSKRSGYFHPHVHLLVSSLAASLAWVRRWLAHFPNASPEGQNIRGLNRREGAARELFKYATKLVTKLDGRHTAIPFAVQDTIYKALKGLRTWQAMGIRAVLVEEATDAAEEGELVLDASTRAEKRGAQAVTWEWCTAVADWVDLTTGEALGAELPGSLARLVANVRNDANLSDPEGSQRGVQRGDRRGTTGVPSATPPA